MITSKEIRSKQFERSGRGYRVEDVDRFLEQLAREVDGYETQKEGLVEKLQVLAERIEEYRKDEDSLRAALLSAQKLGDQIVRDAKQKSEQMLVDAEGKALRIVEGAKEQVEHERIMLSKMKSEVKRFKSRLLSQYKTHLELINQLPDEATEPPDEVPPFEANEPQQAKQSQHAQAAEAPTVSETRTETPPPAPAQPVREREEAPAGRPVQVQQPIERKTVIFEPVADTDESGDDGGFVLRPELAAEMAEADERPSRLNFGDQTGESRFGSLEFGPGFSLGENKKRKR